MLYMPLAYKGGQSVFLGSLASRQQERGGAYSAPWLQQQMLGRQYAAQRKSGNLLSNKNPVKIHTLSNKSAHCLTESHCARQVQPQMAGTLCIICSYSAQSSQPAIVLLCTDSPTLYLPSPNMYLPSPAVYLFLYCPYYLPSPTVQEYSNRVSSTYLILPCI